MLVPVNSTVVLTAIAYAHRHSIVHRDIKPLNIIVTTNQGGHWEAVLIDFDVSRTFEGRSDSGGRTTTTQNQGTFRYMHRAALEDGGADPAMDVYSFGLTMYDVCSGERNRRGGTMATHCLQGL